MTSRLEQLTRLHEADPNDPFCTYGLALEHAKLDQGEQALHWLDRTLEIDPAYFYAYFQKGKVLDDIGRTDEAKVVLQEGIQKARAGGDDHAAGEMDELLTGMDST